MTESDAYEERAALEQMGSDGTFIDSTGLAVAVRDHGGQGLPILLLHGSGCSLAHWLLMAPLLAERHRVVAMDIRGHGLSQAGLWTLDMLTGDIHAVCRHYGFSNVALVGHSMGGVLATLHAERNSDIAAVVNLDGYSLTPPEYVGLDPADVVERRRLFHAEEAASPSPVDLKAAMRFYINHFELSDTQAGEIVQRAHRQAVDTKPNEEAQQQTADGIRWLYDDYLGQKSFFETLSSTTCRTLLFRAGRTSGFSDQALWRQELFAAYFAGLDQGLSRLQDSSIVKVEQVNATHGMLLEIPKYLTNRISSFLHGRG